MSLELVREVSRENPDLLQTNLGRTCYRHTSLLIDKLRARGHEAFFVCKSPGEGQYTPPDFQPRTVIGHDGKPYQCSGVSHDAIYCDGKQIDTLGSANEHDRPIFRRNGDPNWSFDSADGPQITASPVWNEIPRDKWRNNNPPLKDGAPILAPHHQPDPQANPQSTPQPPAAPVFPSYDALGGDESGRKITRQLEADYKRAGRPGLDGDCGMWQQRVSYDLLVGNCKTVEESIKRHRAEWCAALGIPVV